MNTILGRKKAFIKFTQTNEASEIASKIDLFKYNEIYIF